MTLNKVDLPQPEGPMIPTNSPGATLNETWSTAVSTPSGVSKRLTISSTTRIGCTGAVVATPESTRSNGTVTPAINRPLSAARLSCAARPAGLLRSRPIPHPHQRGHERPRRNYVAGRSGMARRPVERHPAVGLPRPARSVKPGPPATAGSPADTSFSRRGLCPTRRGRGPPPTPVFPGGVDAIRAGARGNLVDLARGQELDLAHVHGLLLQPRVDLEIDRDIDGVTDVPARDGCAMAAHQRGAAFAHEFGQIAPHLHVLDQQRGVAEMVVGIPHRHLVADRCAHVEDRLDLLTRHSERNDAFAVVVHHRHHIRPRFEERAVDAPFEVRG